MVLSGGNWVGDAEGGQSLVETHYQRCEIGIIVGMNARKRGKANVCW